MSGLIVPLRAKYSAAAYRTVWQAQGSPLVNWTNSLASEISQRVASPVYVAMRYGEPNLDSLSSSLREYDRLYFALLYPQHAASTRSTMIEEIRRTFPKQQLFVLKPFFNETAYRDVLQAHLRAHIPKDAQHLLLSFHGLPVRQVMKADHTKSHCLQGTDCCQNDHPSHRTCYRHHCLVNAGYLEKASPVPTTTCFQSRLGRLNWLQPYTVNVLEELAKNEVKRIAVMCPSFVSDCLETLHEVAIEYRQLWVNLGGEELTLIPALNCQTDWVELLASWIREPESMFEQIA